MKVYKDIAYKKHEIDIDSDNQDLINRNLSAPSFYFSKRFLLTCLICCGVATQYMQQIDMSISIICMVNHTALNLTIKLTDQKTFESQLSHKTDQTCLFDQPKNTTIPRIDGPFVWSKKIQGFVLSSYFYGYSMAQIPSGWIAHKIGGKKVYATAILIGSIISTLVPMSANISYLVLALCRFITGIFHGACKPAISSMFVHWAPSTEKSRMIGFASTGGGLGNILALTIGSNLCLYGFAGGWPSIFYIFGGLGIVWVMCFCTLTSETPSTHKSISNIERDYILQTTKITKTSGKIPWSLIFRSKSCIAIFVTHFCVDWATYLFLTQLPSFMHDILKFDIKSNGLFSALPYIAWGILSSTSSIVSDRLIANNVFQRKTVRKLFIGTGFFVATLSTLSLSFVTCKNPYTGVALLTLGFGFIGLCVGAGHVVNINEIGGEYSGVIFGISNTFGTLPGVIAPYLVCLITENKRQEEWQIVFMISACIYTIGGLFYTIRGDAEPEDWNNEDKMNIYFKTI